MTKNEDIRGIAPLFACVVAAVSFILVIIGVSALCTVDKSSPQTPDTTEQDYITDEFMLIEADTWGEFANYDIIVHKRTKVMYIIYHTSRGVSIQLLLDADGKPLLYEGEIEK